jgi:phosphatidylglycerol:prolipoprotein diacylglycerol transferase
MFPNLFRIGPLTVHTYGVMLASGFLVAVFVVRHYARREKLDPDKFVDLVFYIFLSALLGAKVLQVIVEWDYYSADWSRTVDLLQIGGVYYGGLILALTVAVWYIHRQKLNFWQSADVIVMGLPIGHALGRIGCFFAGCCWGKPAPAGFPLAITFHNPAAYELVGTPLGIRLYATQLYESGLLALLFALLILLYRHKKFHGQQLAAYLVIYGLIRFFDEFLRGDPRGSLRIVSEVTLSTSQIISVFAVVAGIVIALVRRRAEMLPAPGRK